MRLSEARVVLTGASGGIGLAITGALCASGAHVLAISRHKEPLEPLLARYPDQLGWIAADLTCITDRRKVLAAAEAIGGVNMLINAAGINHFAMLEQLDDAEVASMLALNISAPICLTRTLLPLLKKAETAMGECRIDLRLHRLSGLRQLLREQVCPARFFRGLASRTGGHSGRGSLCCPAGHPYFDEQPGGPGAERRVEGQCRRPASRRIGGDPCHRRGSS